MKKLTALLLSLALCFALLAGCTEEPAVTPGTSDPAPAPGPSDPTPAPTPTPTPTPDPAPASFEKIFYWTSTSEFTQVNRFNGNNTLMDLVNGNLFRYVPDATRTTYDLLPELAAKDPWTEDGYTWYLELDKNAKWYNGEPINADTMMYSWKMALDPVLLNSTCSGLAKNFIEVENAFAYYSQASTGVKVDWEDVGFKKVDDYTLSVKTTQRYTVTEVKLHFAMRYTGPVYQPIYDKCLSADGTTTTYGTELDLYMPSGYFYIESWVKGAEYNLKKNPNYVHADEVHLDGMVCRTVSDESTLLELFEKGEIDYLSLGTNGREKYEEDPRTVVTNSATIRELEFNHTHPTKTYLGSAKFRQAIYYALDRVAMAKLAKYNPCAYFIADDYKLGDLVYRQTDRAKAVLDKYCANNGYDPEKAVKLFNEALQETGHSKVEITLMYNEAVEATRMASEYIQTSLTNLFGADKFKMELQARPNSSMVAEMRTAQKGPVSSWDMGWGAWSLSAAAPSANRKFEPYTTTDTRRFAPYQSTKLDTLYAESITEAARMDTDRLVELTAQMEEEYLEQVLACPVFAQTNAYIHSDRCVLATDKPISMHTWAWMYMDLSAPRSIDK